MSVLNQELDFHDLTEEQQAAFRGRNARRLIFWPGHRFYKFSDRGLFQADGMASPWWSGVDPLTAGDAGLLKTREGARSAGADGLVDFGRARSAICLDWNRLSNLIMVQLTAPAWGLVGQAAAQRVGPSEAVSKVAWIGGGWQVFMPNLTPRFLKQLRVIDVGPPWMEIARHQVGVREIAGKGRSNANIVHFHRSTSLPPDLAAEDETAWCSSFVNWVLGQAGLAGTGSAAARSWLHWGKALSLPRYGAITILQQRTGKLTQATGSTSGFHVGFYDGETENSIRLLGGNQSDQVKLSSFSRATYDVRGYRWPS